MAVEHRTHLLARADLGHDRLVDPAIGLAPVLAGRVMPAEVDRIGTQTLDHRQRERVGQAAHHLRLSDLRQAALGGMAAELDRSEEHTSELQSLMRTSYAAFCLRTKTQPLHRTHSGP